MGRRFGPPVCLAFLLSIATFLEAAPEAFLRGKVVDGAGSTLPGATVVVANQASGLREQGTITDAQGAFRFPSLPPGPHYEITISLPGYTTIVITEISLEPGESLEQNVVLPAGDFKETVRVRAKTQTLDTEKVTASTTFTSTFIAELPILGRDYQDILTLAPGVTDVNGTGNPNIHGARDTDVVTLVDGVSTTDPLTGYYGQNLNIESIEELEVITSAATAEYSRAQGGFASILTKSGGNEFKGTFKVFVRSNRLDGDGAGTEDPELVGGFQEERELRDMHFTDLMPFLALSGALVRDRLWYYFTTEYVQQETPVHALSQAFVTPTYEFRNFLKVTWQMHPAHRLAFWAAVDDKRQENQGLSSSTAIESGYTASRGGPTLTLIETAVFSPVSLLESTLSWFDNRFSTVPTTNPDTNHNGILYVDDQADLGGNGDGILQASERDPGEDWDLDGRYDIFEDLNFNGIPLPSEDLDDDGWTRDWHSGCEGYNQEDLNCNGLMDSETDTNLNGRVDPEEDVGIPYDCVGKKAFCPASTEGGTRGNGRFDTEDRNGNGLLDVVGDSGYTTTPFWNDADGDGVPDPGEFRVPLPPDRQMHTDPAGRTTGPYKVDYHDHRKRITWREDSSFFVAEALGTHDFKGGAIYEHEGYDARTFQRATLEVPTRALTATHSRGSSNSTNARPSAATAILGIPAVVNNTATGDNLGLYFQDTWKPVPNLTFGIGLRFDYEDLSSYGYTPFDPVAERGEFDALMKAAGVDTNGDDRMNDLGLCSDPLRNCGPGGDLYREALAHQLIKAAFGRFTRHQREVEIFSQHLGDLTGDGSNDLPGEIGNARRVRSAETFDITNSNLAPRLSLSWDPWGDGKTMAFGSWGRYYDKLFLGSLVLEQGPDTVVRDYVTDHDGVDDEGYPDNMLGLAVSQSPLSAFQVDRGLSTPYSNEWTAGFRRELTPEVLVSLRYVHRDFHDQLQDVDLNHQLVRDPATGQLLDRLGTTICSPPLPQVECERVPNGAPDLAIQNFLFNRVFHLGNTNEQRYRGWELEFVRRLKRKWQMEASYTYSTTQGDAESFNSLVGNDPALAELEWGYLDYDQRHVVKFNAVAYLPGDWRLGGTALWASGLPYSSFSNYLDEDDAGFLMGRRVYGQLGPEGFGFTPEARNVHRNPASYLFNARVMKSFVIGKSSASAFFEVYNLLNSDNLRVYDVRQKPVQLLYLGKEGPVVFPPQVSLDGERDFGRRFQVGFQFDF
ncbi:MAG TPA: TonB-dependent receptor [Candidatus Polarisedimenticolia bacterium]|nr:TonB-dependent receptor [Candidatus Polarisedimenticolia bacterium]